MYYPKSKIIADLYTENLDFAYKKTGKLYTGYYYSTYDGRYFTGKNYSSTAEELIKLRKEYSNIVQSNTNMIYQDLSNKNLNNKIPIFNHIIPTDADYENGYFKRFFCKRVNGDIKSILEINEKQYNELLSNLLYIKIFFNWKISGNINDEIDDNGINRIGVINANLKILNTVEKQLPGITSYIKNLTQFYK